MPTTNINILAVVIASVISSMVLGFLWYGPIFGSTWMKLVGLTKKEIDQAKSSGMAKTYGLSFISSLVMAYVLAHVVDYTFAQTFNQGAITGLWVWLGFVATTHAVHALYENKPSMLYLINIGYHLVELMIMGGILAVWR